MKLTVENTSFGVLNLSDSEVLALIYPVSSLSPGQVIELPVIFRNRSQELNEYREKNKILMTLVEGDFISTATRPTTTTVIAGQVVVVPNTNPYIQQPNVQRFLDEIEDILSSGGAGGGTRFKVEEFTMTSGDILNKYVTLAELPINTNISVAVTNGPQQSYGQDYILAGQNLSWAARGLEPVLETGDEIVVEYEYTD